MINYDVIVIGSGCSGMVSAIAARRTGAKVLIVEKNPYVGGTNVGSMVVPLMSFHAGDKQVVKGIGQEIVAKLIEENQSLGYIPDPLGFCSTVTPVNEDALKNVYFDFIDKENIDLLLNTIVCDCTVVDNKVTEIEVVNKSGKMKIGAKVFIDASGDADLAALAKVPFTFGRQNDNLTQPMTLVFTVGNVNSDAIKDYMKKNPEEFVLRGDYDFEYLGVSGFFKQVKEAKQNGDLYVDRDRVLLFQAIKPDEVTINMTRVLGYNPTDAFSLSKAEVEGRKQLRNVMSFLRKYIPGFEHSYVVKSAQQIGVRESRHIHGKYTLTKDDVIYARKFEHSVAIGSFPIDIHSPTGGNMEFHNVSAENCYEIPVEVLLPVNRDGLLVTGRSISATHEASASSRLTPTCMALGQAAGTLAALAVKKNVSVSDVDVKELQQKLIEDGQVIFK
jgi:hypothetical protein